jgi:hypothetical protein
MHTPLRTPYTFDSIRVKTEFDSSVINESNLQNEKQPEPRISTFLGIKIEGSDNL